ncbi:hypothetical protein [Cellulophaga omnivescoria]|uniref:hypothetical protein n=1 Tax=Cellulophaga omnivescoria TaxID=1888890 RepID=UPI00098628EC|nr:hypothetical protein [Cellulophaga omnivescoria]WBU90911.1 hypothetical protein PBN93_07780 [Cellulophaga omnivescoria]WKB83047.1 hypothetical protein QYR09_08380 [Cellulophaga lytica]
MKKIAYFAVFAFALGTILTSCRDTKTTGEKIEDGVEEVGDGIEEGVEEVGDEIDDAVDDNE